MRPKRWRRDWRRSLAIASVCFVGFGVPAGAIGVSVIDAKGPAHDDAVAVLDGSAAVGLTAGMGWGVANAKRKPNGEMDAHDEPT